MNAVLRPHPIGQSSFPEIRVRRAARRAELLDQRYGRLNASELLRVVVKDVFPGRIALVTSFGSESAVLIDMIAEIDPSLPVIFLNTLKHFPETLAYRDLLVTRYGLQDFREVTPVPRHLADLDAEGALWQHDPDVCCYLRKVLPLEQALEGFDAWITGRKRFQGGVRNNLPRIEAADGRVKINPLAEWRPADIQAHFTARDVPSHPLAQVGYDSIGCAPCTNKAGASTPPRSGRWAGLAKVECGIHLDRQAASPTKELKLSG